MQGDCKETTQVLKEELVHKAAQQMVELLRPWEMKQVHWTTEGDVPTATDGAMSPQVLEKLKP